MRTFFSLIAGLIGFYSFLCLARIVISWFPQAQNNQVSRFLANICDPFFALFRFSFSQIGVLNLSSLFALAALYIFQNIFESLSRQNSFNAFSIIAILINVILSVINSLLTLLLIVLIIRLILQLTGHAFNAAYTDTLDSILAPLYRMANKIAKNDYVASLVVLIIGAVALKVLIFVLRVTVLNI